MAIVVDGCSVIVRSATINAKYPGGIDNYRTSCPNSTFSTDGNVCRVAFMASDDAHLFVMQLAANGLLPHRNNQAEEVAVVTTRDGFAKPCSWLQLGRSEERTIVWLTGTEPGEVHDLAVGVGSEPLLYLTPEQQENLLEFVRSDDRFDTYRDKVTGVELFVGRVRKSIDADRHNELYKQATDLIDGLILLDGVMACLLTPDRLERLRKSIPIFEEVIELNPGNWSAMFFLGKIYQRLNQYETALVWFSRGFRVNPDQSDTIREAAIAAMECGRLEEAIYFCQSGLDIDPDDVGHRSNLALALLFAGKPKDALLAGQEALNRDPYDKITACVVSTTKEVLSGARPCPRSHRDLHRRSGAAGRPWWKFW